MSGTAESSLLHQTSPRMTNTKDAHHTNRQFPFHNHDVLYWLRFSLLLVSLRAQRRKQNRNNKAEPTQVNTNTELYCAYTKGDKDVCLHMKSKQHRTPVLKFLLDSPYHYTERRKKWKRFSQTVASVIINVYILCVYAELTTDLRSAERLSGKGWKWVTHSPE